MSTSNGTTLPLIEEEDGIRQYGDIEASDRRRRKDIDRESARAVKGGATRGRAHSDQVRPHPIAEVHHCRHAVSSCTSLHRLGLFI